MIQEFGAIISAKKLLSFCKHIPSSSSAMTAGIATSAPTTSTSTTTAATTTAATTTNPTTSSQAQGSLTTLNKASYKITKQLPRNPIHRAPPPPPPPPPAPITASQPQPQPQPQPPVYNIDKNDFRLVVQKLTGSPAHHPHTRPSPPPTAAHRPPSSRLHRIRPPPLAHLSPRPPTLSPPPSGTDSWSRPPLSPLPPLPVVSAAADSPITSYMRWLHSGPAGSTILSPSGASAPPVLPPSPLAFGCMPSPRTAYQMLLSPSLLFPPTSPRLPLPSPK